MTEDDTPGFRKQADAQLIRHGYRLDQLEKELRYLREELRRNTEFTEQNSGVLEEIRDSMAIRRGIKRLLQWVVVVASAVGAVRVLGPDWESLMKALFK